MIKQVAVPWVKHSPRFGHEASSHTVYRRCRRSRGSLSRCTSGLVGAFTRIQAGLRGKRPSTGAIFTGIRAVFSAPFSRLGRPFPVFCFMAFDYLCVSASKRGMVTFLM
jgi:hypothetical protein